MRPERGTIRPRTCRRRSWRRYCRRSRGTRGLSRMTRTAIPHRPRSATERRSAAPGVGCAPRFTCWPIPVPAAGAADHGRPATRRPGLRAADEAAGDRPDRSGSAADQTRSAAGRQGVLDRKSRVHLRRRGIKATIPAKTDQQKSRLSRGSAGGRPPVFDGESYKERITVERTINKLKDFRGVAMRTDKREFIFQGTIDVASIQIWLRHPVNQDRQTRPSRTSAPGRGRCRCGRRRRTRGRRAAARRAGRRTSSRTSAPGRR